jgi:hypothetical protein
LKADEEKKKNSRSRGRQTLFIYIEAHAPESIFEVEDAIDVAKIKISLTASRVWFRKVIWLHQPGSSHTC